ncbi:DUF3857 domain-containing transglutaminase family protein [Oryzifoliimicrobium ureilyticus]|uniref:DUF3857 domain-containing transglutaminase family protein n=1 Tax=Oryzifoliimicrobium ureilyticus TaxID=3113724 RepID=UPI0030767F07
MMRRTVLSLFLVTSCAGATGTAQAEDTPFSRSVSIEDKVLPGRLLDETFTEDIKIGSPSAISEVGQIRFPVNEHFYKFEILEAYTLKADGRHVDVAPDKILVSAVPDAPTLSMFEADSKLRTIVFPDLAVGDTVHYKIHMKEKEHVLGGNFSLLTALAPTQRYTSYQLTLDAPKNLKLNEADAGFSKRLDEVGDRQRMTLTLNPQPFRMREPHETDILDHGAYFAISSYPDWNAVGQSFFKGADAASRPSDKIKALAEQITAGIDDKLLQAQAIRDWTAKNIRYFNIILGQGGFVPHPADQVLQNRYGDCKDHVTLMRALLAAKGIQADFALISLGNNYAEPSIPGAYWFNHVILWLPAFNRYTDPTADPASAWVLPALDSDKVVLRINADNSQLERTPALHAASNQLIVKMALTLSPEGTMSGSSETTGTGAVAINLREVAANVALAGGDNLAHTLMQKQNWQGTGTIEAHDAHDYDEPYRLKATMSATTNFLKGKSHPLPIIPRLVVPAYAVIGQAVEEGFKQDFVCRAETFEQDVTLHLPPGWTIDNLPAASAVSAGPASFSLSVNNSGDTIAFVRRLVVDPPHQKCSPADAKAMEAAVSAMREAIGWHPEFKARA